MYVSAPGSAPLTDSSLSWDVFGANIPATSATALRYVPENGTLYVSTFGRGVWSVQIGLPAAMPESPAALLLPMIGLVAVGGTMVLRRRRRVARVALSA